MVENDEKRSEEIEKLVEERVKELRKDLKKEAKEEARKENKELRKEVERLKAQSNNSTTNDSKTSQGISRRQFLKKAGLGSVGLATLMSPASAFSIKDDSFNVQTGTSSNDLSTYLSVGQGGPVNIQNTNLDLNTNDIKNTNKITANTLEANDGSFDGSITDSSGTTHTGELADITDTFQDGWNVSIHTETDTSSITVTLSDYDIYKIFIKATHVTGTLSNPRLDLALNSTSWDSNQYDYYAIDGSTVTGNNKFANIMGTSSTGTSATTSLTLAEGQNNTIKVNNLTPEFDSNVSYFNFGEVDTNFPPSQFTVEYATTDETFDWEIKVFGMTMS